MAGMPFETPLAFDPVVMQPLLDTQPNYSDFALAALYSPFQDEQSSVPEAWLETKAFLEGIDDNQTLFTYPRPLPYSLPVISADATSSVSGAKQDALHEQKTSPFDHDDEEEDNGDDYQSCSASPRPVLRRNLSNRTEACKATGPRKAHNMIEKRYRTNLNDKMAALRDSVPALRAVVHRLAGSDEETDDEQQGNAGLRSPNEDRLVEPAKLNKATILSKATEYIAHLEQTNKDLVEENAHLRSRVAGLEMVAMGSAARPRSVWT